MSLDRDRAKVIEILGNLGLKILCGVVALGILCVLTYFMITDPVYKNKLLYGGVNGIGALIIWKVFGHYFPATK
jgi:hypothetical protein